MEWLNTTYLWTLLAVPAVVVLFLWSAWRRREALKRFGDWPLVQRLTASVSNRRRRWKSALLVLAVALLGVALAGPRIGTKERELTREGVDLIVALDVSASMLAEDVLPNRLEKAKFEIRKLLEQLSGDRVGLVVFAGDAFIQCPLTLDYSAVRLFLDIADPSMVPTPGTDFSAALQSAIQAFELGARNEQDEEPRTRALVFISDGEDHSEEMETVISGARDAGLVIFTTGVGETEGALIPVIQRGRRVGYKTDEDGQMVRSRLEEAVLQQLAIDGGYFRISRTTSNLEEIKSALTRLERTEFAAQLYEEYEEQFQWPLAAGLALLLVDLFIGIRRKEPTESEVTKSL